ncbi:MAG TPA: RNA-binding domain-containing protein [Rectinemataceae bacterium]|nr:RNA-binding domain-containing protein [Rectinemataceae bacterium]
MTIDPLELERALNLGETVDWEFKSAKGGLPGSFWETYSALANTQGGTVVLGVKELPEGRFEVDGLDRKTVARYRKAIFDNANNRKHASLNLLVDADLHEVEVHGGNVLVIRVPRATRSQRPVYLGADPLTGSFKRNNDGDYRCTAEEVRRMFADADIEHFVDSRILARFGLTDLDPTTIKQYRQRMATAKGDHPWLILDDVDFLTKLGAWRKTRTEGEEGLTIAGLLMFGGDEALRDPEGLGQYYVDYREYLDPTLRWSDRIIPDGTWAPNLFQFYQRVWPKLAAGLPTPFRIEGGTRRDDSPAHEALREAFVNALIHGDFTAPGGVVVERRADGFSFENPGSLLISVEQYRRGGVSECRNKSLQTMFQLIGGGDRAGSGVDKIHGGWKSRQWRAPRLELFTQPDRVRLSLPMVSLIPDEVLAELGRLFGKQLGEINASSLQILATALMENFVTNARMQDLLDEHPVDITHLMQALCQKGLLISDNRRRWTSYRLGGLSEAGMDARDAVAPRANSLHRGGSFLHKDRSFLHSEGSSLHTEWIRLNSIAKPIRATDRAKPEKVREVILELCRGQFITADELAILMSRNADHLRNRFLGPMVAEQLLQLRYPAVPQHPEQAYRSAEGMNAVLAGNDSATDRG